MNHEIYMRRALELAQMAEGNTSPNPLVGCVIVDDDSLRLQSRRHHLQ